MGVGKTVGWKRGGLAENITRRPRWMISSSQKDRMTFNRGTKPTKKKEGNRRVAGRQAKGNKKGRRVSVGPSNSCRVSKVDSHDIIR
jgi:hypothetical protein